MKHVHLFAPLLAMTAMLSLNSPVSKAAAAAAPAFHWKNDTKAGEATLYCGDEPAIRYMYAFDRSSDERAHETYKVYHHVFGPGSGAIITKGPHGKYTHHRGLYVGWNRTSFAGRSLDFWHCTKGAHQRHVRFLKLEDGSDSGLMTAEIHWNDGDGQPVLIEERTVSVRREPDTSGWQIDWSTRLKSQRGDITLDGDRQHAGFQFRAAQPVAESNGATYLRPSAFPQQDAAIQVGDKGDPPAHINLGWFAMSYELAGQRYTVEYFDNPGLPKPALYSERPYGRFGTFFRTTLKENQPLSMTYRVVVSSGPRPDVSDIQKRCDRFVSQLP